MISTSDAVLDRHLRVVLSQPQLMCSVGRRENSPYHFRCNVCGDSKRAKHKKRAYILKTRSPWSFFCHNCNTALTAEVWLRRYFPEYYRDYFRDLMQEKGTNNNQGAPTSFSESPKLSLDDKKDQSYFSPILEGCTVLHERAIAFCTRRHIPECSWHKWFVSTGGFYKNRVIIPFFDPKGEVYFWQGRALQDDMIPKYLTRQTGTGKAVYGLYEADSTQPVVVTEGPIDSLFVRNAVSLLGSDQSEETAAALLRFNKVYWFDWDDTGRKHSLAHIQAGDKVVLWLKLARAMGLPKREKWDVNDLYLYLNKEMPFTQEELQPYISSALWDSMWIG
jgi:hypothetical protein